MIKISCIKKIRPFLIIFTTVGTQTQNTYFQRTCSCFIRQKPKYSFPFKNITWITKDKCVQNKCIFRISVESNPIIWYLMCIVCLKNICFLNKMSSYYLKWILPAKLMVLFQLEKNSFYNSVRIFTKIFSIFLLKFYPQHAISHISCAATLTVSCSSLSLSSIFHRFLLLHRFSLQLPLALHWVDCTQMIFHLQLTALSFCSSNVLPIHQYFTKCFSIYFEISYSSWDSQ